MMQDAGMVQLKLSTDDLIFEIGRLNVLLLNAARREKELKDELEKTKALANKAGQLEVSVKEYARRIEEASKTLEAERLRYEELMREKVTVEQALEELKREKQALEELMREKDVQYHKAKARAVSKPSLAR